MVAKRKVTKRRTTKGRLFGLPSTRALVPFKPKRGSYKVYEEGRKSSVHVSESPSVVEGEYRDLSIRKPKSEAAKAALRRRIAARKERLEEEKRQKKLLKLSRQEEVYRATVKTREARRKASPFSGFGSKSSKKRGITWF